MCHTEVPEGQETPVVDRSEVRVPVAGGEAMPGTLFTGGRAGPGIVVIADIHGPSPFYEALAARLAGAGHTVLLPDYFFRQGPVAGPDLESAFARRARLDEARTLRDLGDACGWLAERTGAARVGSVGFCMGGTFALDLASARGDMVTVAYYGFPVPQPTIVMPPPRPIDVVESQRGPVLAFWGEEDHGVGLDHVREYAGLAEKANPEFAYEILPGLGHGFLAKARIDDHADPGGRTWHRVLHLFDEHLRGGGSAARA
ncbi:dienelactone hydrolase [Actinocorallia herbida]|uniref:Dienelactone hydrolase n=1 Tax=Actinocorallia herbida TaxID=58109 RepID=A0A3N1D270_9ACTN|nr:dienelactone hydrolase family protein [Actinocorallia herbida]ROO87611.1 dienelactone hydrolase [Actinocorallia herbida]